MYRTACGIVYLIVDNLRYFPVSLLRHTGLPGESILIIHSCDIWYKIIGVVSVLGRAAVICTSSAFVVSNILQPLPRFPVTFLMRTYAVYSKSKAILVGLGAIGLTCVILDCVSSDTSSRLFENPADPGRSCMFQASSATVPQATNCA